MLEKLKEKVYRANLELTKHNLVKYTWGNVSGIDRERNFVVIKPSGVKYEEMKKEDMVVVDFDGNVVEGDLNPSSDTPTHIELYKEFPKIGGVVHTHSLWSTIFSQAGKDIKVYGTTHADYFYGKIPCTRKLTIDEVLNEYEKATGKLIVETFREKKIDPNFISAVLIHGHGPFVWGNSPEDSVYKAVVLEELSKMAFNMEILTNDKKEEIDSFLLEKHFTRKHGKKAYYGQNNNNNQD